MADQRSLHIVDAKEVGPQSRFLDCVLPEGELGFVGGQYIIINSGMPLPGGRVAKRAYSILSGDEDQKRFQLAVRWISAGPGSTFMNTIEVGHDIPFSGPWGQFFPNDNESQSALVIATDTGITAALGLLSGRRFESLRSSTDLLWFVESDEYFLSPSFIHKRLSRGLRSIDVMNIPPVGHSGRMDQALRSLDRIASVRNPSLIFLSGDGDLLYPFREFFIEKGVDQGSIKMECFFNNPKRKAGP